MIPSGVKVFLASHPVDFRKGINGLVALVRDAGSDPFDRALAKRLAEQRNRCAYAMERGRLTASPCRVLSVSSHSG
ncbi:MULTISPECIES: IS66 family insertion sequence element accessory protein TnpB [Bradyrhizobium]|uniref:IS66 family insertion sequence element accessory protein TnpB n=1 Tax=Bradyrhizobium quebecense TaxID=2748629 RepID=A0A973WSJ4_9BRAD|nr:IS66 family insertion sequence element accessory protein TnpB [Bradyrhizobium sp. 41S5]